MAGTCLRDRDCGPCWLQGRKVRLGRHTPSPIRKVQIFHDLSKHLVFIQTLLPFHNTGYFSLKGNSCPINKGRWEGAWGRLRAQARQMQKAFPRVLQLTARG